MCILTEIAICANTPEKSRDFLRAYYRCIDTAEWHLSFDGECYTLSNRDEKLAMTLDFRTGNYRHRQANPSKEPLAQAVKIKKKLPNTLIDATPGVLKDALMLAQRGVAITAIERNPILFIMVKQALEILSERPSIDYHFGDASVLLFDYSAEIIYLDPMYPPPKNAKKSAQVKKDMQILHQIVGTDNDAHQLFAVARKQKSRLVVKRPSYAEPLAQEPPSFTSQTGATRFDVYLPKAL